MATKRIEVIDAIRGFAVFGILLANIQSWSGYKFLPYTVIDKLNFRDYDFMLHELNILFVDSKFYAIFSILFGVGFGLQWLKNESNAERFLPLYRRRMGFLLLFGICHALIWSGDILTLYALLAFVMIALRNLSEQALLRAALFLLAVFLVPQVLHMLLTEPTEAGLKVADQTYSTLSWDALVSGLSSNNWGDIFSINLHNLYWRWMKFLPEGRVSRVLGLFLLGCYLARSGFFTRTALRPRMILIFLIPGLAFTILAMQLGLSMGSWARDSSDLLAKSCFVAGQTLMALSYMCILSVIYTSRIGEQLLRPLTLIGRTAFTSYLSQTFIGIAIFYGVGMSRIGTLGLMELWLLAIVIYTGQVIFSSVWLRFYKQGPIEWLWRCLSSKRFTANRISN